MSDDARNETVVVVTRIDEHTIYSTYINLEDDDEPYIVGMKQHGPPFATDKDRIPEVGETIIVYRNHATGSGFRIPSLSQAPTGDGS